MTLERDIERPAAEYAKLRRWFSFKLMAANINGLPDRWFMRRVPTCPACGNSVKLKAIEFKSPTGKLRPDQVTRIAELRAAGVDVEVINDLDAAKAALK